MRSQFLSLNLDMGVGGEALSGAVSGAAAGSVVPGIGTVVGGLVGGAIGLFEGLSQKKKAADLAKNNPYPVQSVPQAVLDNQQLAKENANVGLPSQVYQNATKEIQRSQTAALRAATDRRTGVGAIGQIQQNTNDAQDRLNAASQQARVQNTNTLYGVNNQVGAYQQSAFDWNQKNRYQQQYQYSQALQGAGNANIVGGADKAIAGLLPTLNKPGLFGGGGYGGGTTTSSPSGGGDWTTIPGNS